MNRYLMVATLMAWGAMAHAQAVTGWASVKGQASAIAISPDGGVYIADTGRFELYSYTNSDNWGKPYGESSRIGNEDSSNTWRIAVSADNLPWFLKRPSRWTEQNKFSKVISGSGESAQIGSFPMGDERQASAFVDIATNAKGMAWAITGEGNLKSNKLRLFENGKWKGVMDVAADRIAVDPQGMPWLVISNNDQIARFDGTKLQPLPQPGPEVSRTGMSNPRRGEPRPITVAGYKAISIGADGSVFAIHKSGDIVRWEGKAWRKVEHSIPNPAEIAVDPRGQPWVLAQDGSIFAFGDAKAKAKLTKQMINIPCPDNFASRPVISASAPLPEGWNGPGLRLNDISDVKFVGARYVPEANQKTYRLECRYGESKAKNGMPYSMVKNGLLPGCSHPSFKPEKTGPGHFACMEKEERQCILTCPSI